MENIQGECTGGIFGTIRLIASEIRMTDAFPVVVFDHGLAPRRLDVDPTYKRANEREINRDEVLSKDEARLDYITQYRFSRKMLSQILPYFGIPVVKMIPWEGDDLMYVISRMSEEATILTDDRDLLQLLSPTVNVRRPKANQNYTLEKFLEETGYDNMHEFVMQKAICGDGSDNITGSCPGVAGGTAPALIKVLENTILQNKEFPKDELELREICKELGTKYKKAFLNFNKEKYEQNLKLVDLNLVDEDVNQQILDSIIATISDCENKKDFFEAQNAFKRFEIEQIDPSDMIQLTTTRHGNLFVK